MISLYIHNIHFAS